MSDVIDQLKRDLAQSLSRRAQHGWLDVECSVTVSWLRWRGGGGMMLGAYAFENGIRSQDVSNYTWGKRSRKAREHRVRNARIVCEHFSISLNCLMVVKVLLKCAIRFSILYANFSFTCVRCTQILKSRFKHAHEGPPSPSSLSLSLPPPMLGTWERLALMVTPVLPCLPWSIRWSPAPLSWTLLWQPGLPTSDLKNGIPERPITEWGILHNVFFHSFFLIADDQYKMSVWQFDCLPLWPSVSLTVCLFCCLPLWLSVSLTICLPVCLFDCLPLWLLLTGCLFHCLLFHCLFQSLSTIMLWTLETSFLQGISLPCSSFSWKPSIISSSVCLVFGLSGILPVCLSVPLSIPKFVSQWVSLSFCPQSLLDHDKLYRGGAETLGAMAAAFEHIHPFLFLLCTVSRNEKRASSRVVELERMVWKFFPNRNVFLTHSYEEKRSDIKWLNPPNWFLQVKKWLVFSPPLLYLFYIPKFYMYTWPWGCGYNFMGQKKNTPPQHNPSPTPPPPPPLQLTL